MHIGSAAIPARVRRLGRDTVRLTLDTDVPLRVGDIALLRDPGRHQIIGGATVLDPQPPAFHRRGDARRRTDLLATMTGIPHAADELRRRHLIRTRELRALGVSGPVTEVTGGWVADPEHWEQLKAGLVDAVTQHANDFPLEAGLSADVARQRLDLPDTQIVKALVEAPLEIRNGRLAFLGSAGHLPAYVQRAIDALHADLMPNPWAAPRADRLTELGLGPHELEAAVRAGALERIGTEIYLLPGSIDAAATTLRALCQPFTVSQARSTLRTSRRVAVPLLELLDSGGITCRVSESGRRFMETEGLSPGPR